jgi:hypothetical protein
VLALCDFQYLLELRVLANKTHERYENQILLTREVAFNDTCLHHSGLNAFELDKFIVCWSLLHIKNIDDWTQGMYAHGKLVALLWLLDGPRRWLSYQEIALEAIALKPEPGID